MKQSVCLNMIVKNERAVIERCLASVKKWIDYWVIIDTGSHDGTQEMICRFLQDIPGELWERPWVDFAHNRNEALALAKNHGDYLLMIDADETLRYPESFQMPPLDQDGYFVCVQTITNTMFYRYLLIKSRLDWSWVGVVHEALISSQAQDVLVLDDILLYALQEGDRSKDPSKFLKDAQILEKALELEPENSRYRFFLAISYGNAGQLAQAIENHEKRAAMAGDPQETFYSLLTIAEHQEALKMDPTVFIGSYCRAFLFRPNRLEPLSCMAKYYINTGCFLIGYLVTKYALSQPISFETSFVRFPVYTYELLVQFAECAYQIGRMDEYDAALQQLKKNDQIPAAVRQRIDRNFQ